MDVLFCFLIFGVSVIVALILSVPLIFPVSLALVCFALAALKRGFSFRLIMKSSFSGLKSVLIVAEIFLLIGSLTALWRSCGTIGFFSYYGVRIIPAKLFIPGTFMLASVTSYALGSAPATASAVGVILMTIARLSGVPAALAAGAILSGAFFGDRTGPAAANAVIIANETHTNLSSNFRKMLKAAVVPFLATLLIYCIVSIFFSIDRIDAGVVDDFAREFVLSPLCLIPTVLLLILALCSLDIRLAILVDIAVAFSLSLFLQKQSFSVTLRTMLTGFNPRIESLAPFISGGGLTSMLSTVALLVVSCACSGIFQGTKMLDSVTNAFYRLAARIGRFPTLFICSVCGAMVFCSQSVSIVLCSRCLGDLYDDPEEFMLDLEDSAAISGDYIPWCIASTVPVKTIGAGPSSIPFTFFLFLLPVYHYLYGRFHKRRK